MKKKKTIKCDLDLKCCFEQQGLFPGSCRQFYDKS